MRAAGVIATNSSGMAKVGGEAFSLWRPLFADVFKAGNGTYALVTPPAVGRMYLFHLHGNGTMEPVGNAGYNDTGFDDDAAFINPRAPAVLTIANDTYVYVKNTQ